MIVGINSVKQRRGGDINSGCGAVMNKIVVDEYHISNGNFSIANYVKYLNHLYL